MTERLEERIAELEKRVTKVEKDDAVMVSQFTTVASDVKEIKSSQAFVVKLIISSLVLAIMGFFISGGFFVG